MPVQKEAKVLEGAIKWTIQRRGKLIIFNEVVFIRFANAFFVILHTPMALLGTYRKYNLQLPS